MKKRSPKNISEIEGTSHLSMRLKEPIAERFNAVVETSKRTKSSIITECLEGMLPKLERQYSKAA